MIDLNTNAADDENNSCDNSRRRHLSALESWTAPLLDFERGERKVEPLRRRRVNSSRNAAGFLDARIAHASVRRQVFILLLARIRQSRSGLAIPRAMRSTFSRWKFKYRRCP